MNITRIEDAPIARKVEGFEGRKLANGPVAELVHIRLEPGAVMAPHATPVDATFFALEGEAEFECGGEKIMFGAGMLSQSPRGTVHGFRNVGSVPFRVLVVKGLN